MNLWIRSQDKSSIVKVDNLYVSIGNYICYYVEKGKEVPDTYYRPSGELGRYKTKKRALEVLDEIQNILKPNIEYVPIVEEDVKPEYTYKHYKSVGYEVSGCKFEQFDTYVYEMPKE